jgi:dihydrofolate synthase/folylpolyglutamate synthase
VRAKEIFNQYQRYLKPYDPRFVSKDFLQLHRIKLLLKKMGGPEKKLIGVQVAGTKGKGSTVAFLERILREAGYTTGSFYSPYLVSPSERIMINGRPIPMQRIKKIGDQMVPFLKEIGEKGDQVTFFEFTTALAVQYFAEEKVEIVVMEVGMGGRLDATTAVGLKNKIITNISYDHTNSLGNTITKIAGEKAGIIQANDEIVTATRGNALKVIKDRMKAKKASLININQDLKYLINKVDLTGTHIDISYRGESYKNLRLSLIGKHQAENFACAFGAVQQLRKQGFIIKPKDIIKAAGRTEHEARFQVWQRNPLIILDGAHNLFSIRALVKALRDVKIKSSNTVFVVSIKNTKKQVPEMLRTLSSFSKKIIFPDVTKIDDLKDFYHATKLKKYYPEGLITNSLPAGIAKAKKIAGKNGTVVITGSLYTIGEILKNGKLKGGR